MAAIEGLAGARASEQRVPDFFVVGHFKCGTTALYRMLKRHPQIYMPDIKELWFLSPELRPFAASRKVEKLPKTLDQYLSLFESAAPAQRVGENSPSYLFSHEAAARIAELQPDARVIAILREPASFLRSFHLQAVRNHFEPEFDLRKALALEGERSEGRNIPPDCYRPFELLYSQHVRYVEQLRRYYAVLAPEQILVLIYEDFLADNEAVMRQVLRFLEVDETVPLEPLRANQSVGVRSPGLYALMRSLYMGRGGATRLAKRAIKAVTSQRLRRSALRSARQALLSGEPDPPDEELMLELRRRFKGEVEDASAYLGRDLVALWGYEEIA